MRGQGALHGSQASFPTERHRKQDAWETEHVRWMIQAWAVGTAAAAAVAFSAVVLLALAAACVGTCRLVCVWVRGVREGEQRSGCVHWAL